MRDVYADNNATTMVAPEVREAMLPFFRDLYGNPSSMHHFGETVSNHLCAARESVADFLGAHPDEIMFTSCGTESNGAAIHATLSCYPGKRHIVTTAVEHPAVLNLCHYLSKNGYEVTELSVDQRGHLDLAELEDSLREDTAIVSIMYANNETGVLFPIKKIAEIVKNRDIVLHTDAVQAVGKIPLDLTDLPVDLLSSSGHKFHAPKGIGFLFIRKGTRFVPLLRGGHQEKGRRAGTENVPYIVGLAKACAMAAANLGDQERVRELRDRMEEALESHIAHVQINGDRENRLPNTANISFLNVEGESILLFLDREGIGVSTGSACASGDLGGSHVLRAMGISATAIHSSIRFSLSRYTTAEEVDYIIEKVPPIVERLRKISPLERAKV